MTSGSRVQALRQDLYGHIMKLFYFRKLSFLLPKLNVFLSHYVSSRLTKFYCLEFRVEILTFVSCVFEHFLGTVKYVKLVCPTKEVFRRSILWTCNQAGKITNKEKQVKYYYMRFTMHGFSKYKYLGLSTFTNRRTGSTLWWSNKRY